MNPLSRIKAILALIGLVFGGAALAQSSHATGGSLAEIEEAFNQEQQNLADETATFLSEAGSVEEFQVWSAQHAAEFQAQQQNAEAISAACAMQPFLSVEGATSEGEDTSELGQLIQGQRSLANAYALAHNGQIQISLNSSSEAVNPGTTGQANVNQAPLTGDQAFQLQNAAQIQVQQQHAQNVAAAMSQVALPMSPPLVLPSGATSAQISMLTLRDQLMRGEITVMNQYVLASPSVRKAMVDQWHQQNVGRFQQLQQMLQNLAP